jgi:hypothetical protein
VTENDVSWVLIWMEVIAILLGKGRRGGTGLTGGETDCF